MSATSPGSLPQVGLGDSERWEESGRERPAWTILEPCWSSLKRLERSWNTWTLETCWIHVGYMLDFVQARTHIEPMTPTPYFSVSPLLARIIHPKWAHTGLNRSHLGLVGLVGLVGQRLPEDQEVALEDPGGDGFNMHHLWFHWNKKYRKQRHEKKHISQKIRPRL